VLLFFYPQSVHIHPQIRPSLSTGFSPLLVDAVLTLKTSFLKFSLTKDHLALNNLSLCLKVSVAIAWVANRASELPQDMGEGTPETV